MATFICPQGGRCREVKLYLILSEVNRSSDKSTLKLKFTVYRGKTDKISWRIKSEFPKEKV